MEEGLHRTMSNNRRLLNQLKELDHNLTQNHKFSSYNFIQQGFHAFNPEEVETHHLDRSQGQNLERKDLMKDKFHHMKGFKNRRREID